MLFIIESGKPYLVNNGKAYPVEISGDAVRVDEKNAAITNSTGAYTLKEIRAKLGDNVSSIPKKKPTKEK